MGILDNVGDAVNNNRDKISDAAKKHGDKIDSGIDRAGDVADKKTGGKYAKHVDKGQSLAKDQVDRLGGPGEDPARQEARKDEKG